MDLALFLLRVVVGLLFVGHGAQKLFGSFGGPGLEGTRGFFDSLGYRRARTMAVLAGWTEFGCGVLLVIGLLVPFAAAGIIGVMINAIITVHLRNGMWNSSGGSEFPLVLATVATALAFIGPGAWSIANATGMVLNGYVWGSAALTLGIVGGLFILSMRRVQPARAETAPTERRAA